MTAISVAGIFRGGFKVAERVVFDGVMPAVFEVERHLIGAIRQHLEQLDAQDSPAEDENSAPPAPDAVLESLLERSLFYSREDSRQELYSALLNALVPDEARILAALADGSTYPVVHIAEPTGTGGSSETILTNASTVGRVAGISLPDYTPLYLARMTDLGLVAIGPEGPSAMATDYELLLTDNAVAVAQAKARRGIRGARVIKRTVSITALGQEVWEAAK